MTRTIKIIQGMADCFAALNSFSPYHEKKNGVKVRSDMSENLVSIRSPDGTYIGKNSDETLTTGTLAEVHAGTAQIADDVSDRFIALGFAIDTQSEDASIKYQGNNVYLIWGAICLIIFISYGIFTYSDTMRILEDGIIMINFKE